MFLFRGSIARFLPAAAALAVAISARPPAAAPAPPPAPRGALPRPAAPPPARRRAPAAGAAAPLGSVTLRLNGDWGVLDPSPPVGVAGGGIQSITLWSLIYDRLIITG